MNGRKALAAALVALLTLAGCDSLFNLLGLGSPTLTVTPTFIDDLQVNENRDITVVAKDKSGKAESFVANSSPKSVATASVGIGKVTLHGVAVGEATVTIQSSSGEIAYISVTVIAAAVVPPVANAGSDQSVSAGSTITLNGSASTGAISTYAWEILAYPSGSTAALSSATSAAPSFTADLAGTYSIKLTVANEGGSSSDTITVTAVAPPVANAGSDFIAVVNTIVTLDGSESTGQISSYAWLIQTRPSGSAAILSDTSAASPSFTPDKEGSYTFKLTVKNSVGGSSSDYVTLSVSSVLTAPTANAGNDKSALVGAVVTLDASASVGANITGYAWEIVAGPSGYTATLTGATTSTPRFTPDLAGSYTIQLTVTNGAGSTTDSVIVTASTTVLAPTANAGIDQSAYIGSIVTLDGSASTGQNLGYLWTLTLPSGSSAKLSGADTATPYFTPDVAGTYTLQLTVTNTAGSKSDTVIVTASETLEAKLSVDSDALTISTGGSATINVVSLSAAGAKEDFYVASNSGPTFVTATPNLTTRTLVLSGGIATGSATIVLESSSGLTVSIYVTVNVATLTLGADVTMWIGDTAYVSVASKNADGTEAGYSIAGNSEGNIVTASAGDGQISITASGACTATITVLGGMTGIEKSFTVTVLGNLTMTSPLEDAKIVFGENILIEGSIANSAKYGTGSKVELLIDGTSIETFETYSGSYSVAYDSGLVAIGEHIVGVRAISPSNAISETVKRTITVQYYGDLNLEVY